MHRDIKPENILLHHGTHCLRTVALRRPWTARAWTVLHVVVCQWGRRRT